SRRCQGFQAGPSHDAGRPGRDADTAARREAALADRPLRETMDRFDFGRGTAAGFDGSVHIALPLEARVLAGEEQPAERAREPLAQRRIEGRIEEGVAAPRPRIGFPDDLPRSDELVP